jgi:metal-responsive CopG/Arc/MetJ family transcriptional regulator
LAKLGTKSLNMNIKASLLDRVDEYRFRRMFPSRSEAIEFLLDVALKINPDRSDQKSVVPEEEL